MTLTLEDQQIAPPRLPEPSFTCGTAKQLILPGENRQQFESLLNELNSDYQPATAQHRIFIEQLAISHWLLFRRQRLLNAIETSVFANADNDPQSLAESDFHRLTLAERCKTAAERALKRAFQNAEALRKDRQGSQTRLERQARWQAQQDIRERRLKLQEQKQTAAAESAAQKLAAANEALHPPSRLPKYLPGSDAWKKDKAESAARCLLNPPVKR